MLDLIFKFHPAFLVFCLIPIIFIAHVIVVYLIILICKLLIVLLNKQKSTSIQVLTFDRKINVFKFIESHLSDYLQNGFDSYILVMSYVVSIVVMAAVLMLSTYCLISNIDNSYKDPFIQKTQVIDIHYVEIDREDQSIDLLDQSKSSITQFDYEDVDPNIIKSLTQIVNDQQLMISEDDDVVTIKINGRIDAKKQFLKQHVIDDLKLKNYHKYHNDRFTKEIDVTYDNLTIK